MSHHLRVSSTHLARSAECLQVGCLKALHFPEWIPYVVSPAEKLEKKTKVRASSLQICTPMAILKLLNFLQIYYKPWKLNLLQTIQAFEHVAKILETSASIIRHLAKLKDGEIHYLPTVLKFPGFSRNSATCPGRPGTAKLCPAINWSANMNFVLSCEHKLCTFLFLCVNAKAWMIWVIQESWQPELIICQCY